MYYLFNLIKSILYDSNISQILIYKLLFLFVSLIQEYKACLDIK